MFGRHRKVVDRVRCALCDGTGDNKTGIVLQVNNHLCPRCGGYGSLDGDYNNPEVLTAQDREYCAHNHPVNTAAAHPAGT